MQKKKFLKVIKMKKIITAINNPKLNEELKKEKNFEIIGKDIQYKEAILEILEENDNIDLIILSEKILGEIKLEKLIEKIKIINEKIKIIFILEKENNDLEKILIKNNIIDIYYNNKINLDELIKIINKKEINMEEEIIKLKKIIEKRNINDKTEKEKNSNKSKFNFQNKYLKKMKNQIKQKIKKNDNIRNDENKIITFSGNYKSGKSTLALIISQCLSEKKYKILLIDADLEKQDLSIILKKNKWKKNKTNKKKIMNIANNEFNIFINKKNTIYYYEIKNKINLFTNKINKNLYFFYGFHFLLKHKKKKKVIEKIIYLFLQEIQNNYHFIIIDLSKNNLKEINQNILRKSNINFISMEANLLGIRETQKLLKLYIKRWNIHKKSLHIVSNKKGFCCMNKQLISNCIGIKNKIYEVKENKFYYSMMSHYFKRKVLLKNKNIRKEINKIIYQVIMRKR